MAASLAGCFTGVESTPRIGSSEVRRANPGGTPAERRHLASLAPTRPAQWGERGLRLLVDDDRLSRVLAPGTAAPERLKGRIIEYAGASRAVSLTGDDAVDLSFRDIADSTVLTCRMAVTYEALDTLERLDIPFTVDLGLVARADSALRGSRLYVATPDWYGADGNSVFGLRHVEATVDSVVAGTFIYPAAVYFSLTEPSLMPGEHFLYMSVGGVGAQARSFDRLFEFESPRRHHPEIDDDTWMCIMRSRLKKGMTPAECRLALGSPSDILRVPTRGGMREQWSYPDGVFLVFDDGYLSRFRQ